MRKWVICVAMVLFLTGNSFSVVISTIDQLDAAALFSFSLQSDNKGYDRTHAPDAGGVRSQRMEDWIKTNDEFCIGVGDHVFPLRDRWLDQMQNDPFFHNNYYPVLGDHDNETKYFYGVTGTQDQWGRGWVIFKTLNNFFNRPDVQFRPKQSTKINNNGKLYDDQLVDYYAVREHSGFKIHIIATHYGDASVFANRTKEWMMQKINALGAVKTDRDIIIVLVHCSGNFFKNVVAAGSVEDGYSPMSTAEMDKLMMTADLICDASDHIFRRHHERDGMYDGTEALWINTGALDTGACCGYVNVHVFDNPPRFTMQYIDVETKSTRTLHVGNSLKIAADNPYIPYRYAYMKQINGPIQKIDWNNFPINAATNTPPAVSLAVPSANVTVNAGTNLYVKVNATDPDGISQVRLYKNGVKLVRNESSGPYEWALAGQNDPELQNLATGSFVLTAEATDSKGLIGKTSSSVTVTVKAANQPPYFTSNPFSSPDATTGVAYSQAFSAKAVDPEGGTKTFSKVAGPAWLSVTSAGNAQGTPGSVDAGTNSFSVKVTDNGGLSATATMTIKVVQAVTAPVVSFIAPTNLTATAGSTLYVNVSAADPNGISRVRLYKNGVELARSEGGAPYEWNGTGQSDPELQNLQAGSFVLTAKATDNSGSVGEKSVTINVVNPQTVTFTSVAAEDGYMSESAETSNIGGSSDTAGTGGAALRIGDTATKQQYKSIVSFDTSSVPDGAVIRSATLKLMRGSISGTPTTLGLIKVDIKGGTGFNNATALSKEDFQAAADATNVATMSYPSANGTLSTGNLNATGLTKVNKTGKTQLKIYFATDDDNDTTSDYLGFYSGDNSTAANRPVLVVTYQ